MRKEYKQAHIDLYSVYEYAIIGIMSFSRAVSVIFNIFGPRMYAYQMIFNSGMLYFLLFEYINLTKIYNLVIITRGILAKSKTGEIKKKEDFEKFGRSRIRFEFGVFCTFISLCLLLVCFYIVFLILQRVLN